MSSFLTNSESLVQRVTGQVAWGIEWTLKGMFSIRLKVFLYGFRSEFNLMTSFFTNSESLMQRVTGQVAWGIEWTLKGKFWYQEQIGFGSIQTLWLLIIFSLTHLKMAWKMVTSHNVRITYTSFEDIVVVLYNIYTVWCFLNILSLFSSFFTICILFSFNFPYTLWTESCSHTFQFHFWFHIVHNILSWVRNFSLQLVISFSIFFFFQHLFLFLIYVHRRNWEISHTARMQ